MKIKKQTFQEDFSYLFKPENQDFEIKLDEYQLMELFTESNEVIKYDINKINELCTMNENENVVVVNFFCDTLDTETLEKLQDEFDVFCDTFANEPLCMWCTTSQIYNTKKLYAEIFLAI